MSAYLTAEAPYPRSRQLSDGVRRLALVYLYVAVASISFVSSEPAPYDALMVGAAFVLPIAGLASFNRGIALYLMLWAAIVAGGFIAATQATSLSISASHMGITFYLAFSSVVIAAFVTNSPQANMRLILSAYMLAALIGALAALIGYFSLFPGAYDLFTEYGRARGTFKDPNVLGAFLVPALVYAFNLVMTASREKALLAMLTMPILLFGLVLTFSRGAWINLGVSISIYAYLTFVTAVTNRHRLKLIVAVLLAGIFAVGVFGAAQSIPQVADLMGERTSLEQSYDVGPEGRFGGQVKAVGLIVTHPLGIGALEFHEHYHHEDVHEVYLSMLLNTGWVGGLLYLFAVLATMALGLRQSIGDRGGDGISAVLAASFIGMAFEGVVIDTDHWRHFYLLMAMVWGMAVASPRLSRWTTPNYGER